MPDRDPTPMAHDCTAWQESARGCKRCTMLVMGITPEELHSAELAAERRPRPLRHEGPGDDIEGDLLRVRAYVTFGGCSCANRPCDGSACFDDQGDSACAFCAGLSMGREIELVAARRAREACHAVLRDMRLSGHYSSDAISALNEARDRMGFTDEELLRG